MVADRLELVCGSALGVNELPVENILVRIQQEGLPVLILHLLEVLNLRIVVHLHVLFLPDQFLLLLVFVLFFGASCVSSELLFFFFGFDESILRWREFDKVT